MKYLQKLTILFICTLTLTGCNPEMFVSQTPKMADFIERTPEQIYRQAESALQARRYSRAISSFRAFIRLHPDHKKAEIARIDLIKCYSARGQFKDALKEIETFMRLYPNSQHYDTLKKREKELRRKEKMDRFYHLAWLKDVKSKNKTSYHGLVKRFDQLTE